MPDTSTLPSKIMTRKDSLCHYIEEVLEIEPSGDLFRAIEQSGLRSMVDLLSMTPATIDRLFWLDPSGQKHHVPDFQKTLVENTQAWNDYLIDAMGSPVD